MTNQNESFTLNPTDKAETKFKKPKPLTLAKEFSNFSNEEDQDSDQSRKSLKYQ